MTDQPSKSKETVLTTDKQPSPLLDQVVLPEDLRSLSLEQLPALAEELRNEVISTVSKTGGHLGAGLGVIELTLALHYVFNTPEDRLIWDVGHQTYPHKILTGRRDRLHTLRQKDGLSGFVTRSESPYDCFGTAHSSTSISAGLGMATARDLEGEKRSVISVIGDGALSAGMAFEAMNNAGAKRSRMLIILNDNEMSISKPVGALSAYLARLISSKPFLSLRSVAKDIASHFPKVLETAAKRAEEYSRGLVTGGTLFEELGLFYLGPVDGHRLDHLIPILKNIKNTPHDGPILLHVITQKGKGYAPAEQAEDKYHGVTQFDVATGHKFKKESNLLSYTRVFSDALLKEAKKDDQIVAITAAMAPGTGLSAFEKEYPDRFFDVGIAEQHAVTFAAGLACEGYKPFVAIYSTFLQRAYDQVIHDVALQNLPVRFVLDRAGYVGADGQTHHGSFDLSYLGCLPNMVIVAPAQEEDLVHAVATLAQHDTGPIALRYPRGEGVGLPLPKEGIAWPIGTGKLIRKASLIETKKKKIALLSIGTRLDSCLRAAEILDGEDFTLSVADFRFVKPLDQKLLLELADSHDALITIEENSIGGFGSQVLHCLAAEGRLDKNIQVRTLMMPDCFIEHNSQNGQLAQAGLDQEAILKTVRNL